MQQSIHAQVEHMAEALQFGAPTAAYQHILSPAMKRKRYGGILLCIVWIMFFPSFMLIGSLVSTPRQPAVILISAIFFITFCIFTIVLTTILLRRVTTVWLVFLYGEWFISAKRRKIDVVRWDQVRTIDRVVLNCDRLERTNGKPLFFDDTFLNLETTFLLDPRDRDWSPWRVIGRQEAEVALLQERWLAARNQTLELMYVLEREITTRLFPTMVASFQEGLPVAFGPLELSREGISNGRKLLHWEKLDQITLWGEEDGLLPESVPYADNRSLVERLQWWQEEIVPRDTMRITIKEDEREIFWSYMVSKISNAFLLMELTNYALRQQVHNE